MRKHIGIIVSLLVLILFVSSCGQNEGLNNDNVGARLVLVNVSAIDAYSIEAEFANSEKVIITEFSPKPLVLGENDVSFKYQNNNYEAKILFEVDYNEVHVNISKDEIRRINADFILGGNTAIWNSPSLLTPQMEKYFKDTGCGIVRFPGGNNSNYYCWKEELHFNDDYNETGIFENYEDWSPWATNVDDYLDFMKKIDAVPLYSLNPFSHVVDDVTHDYVEEAVDLVKKMKEEGFAGAYYEVGNENEGDWVPTLTLDEYVDKYIALAEAVKAEDPEAKMMGPVSAGYEEELIQDFVNELVERNKLHLLDYISHHFYGAWNYIDMSSAQELEDIITSLRNFLSTVNNGDQIKIAITEYNSALWDEVTTTDQYTVKQALWLGEFMGELFVNQVDIANIWITLHSSPQSLVDNSSGEIIQNYWASYLVNRALGNSSVDVTVLTTTNNESIDKFASYAVKKDGNRHGILLVNKEDVYKKVSISIDSISDGLLKTSIFSEQEYDDNKKPVVIPSKWENDKIEVIVSGNSITAIEVN